MKKFTRDELLRSIAKQTIQVSASGAAMIDNKLSRRIAKSSFVVDQHADEMAQIGAEVLGEYLLNAEVARLELFGEGVGEPYIVADGLPQQTPLPPTPQMFGDDSAVQFIDTQLLGLIRLAGLRPVAVSYENFGRLMRNVAPMAAAVASVSSWGAKEPLDFHTDNAYEFEGMSGEGSPSPRFLCFSGLRNQDALGQPVPTELLRVMDIVQAADATLLKSLQQPEFRLMPGQSNDRSFIDNVPLLQKHPVTGEWLMRFNANGQQTVGITTAATAAVEFLKGLIQSLDDAVLPIVIRPGSFLMFDNYRVLHRRRSFEPGEDLGKARWLRRCFACQNLRNGKLLDIEHRPFVWN